MTRILFLPTSYSPYQDLEMVNMTEKIIVMTVKLTFLYDYVL